MLLFSHQVYDLGLICGRFGPAHIGHNSLFDYSLLLCRRTLILVGSAQEHGTLRNPFRVETRIELIKMMYPNFPEDVLMIRPLADLTNEYDITTDWGKYLKEEVIFHKHKFASLMVYGNDEFRSQWFAQEDLVNSAELIIPRSTIPISGTMMRGYILLGDEISWQRYTHALAHGMYSRLRDELMQVLVYKQIYDEIRRGSMDLDSYMKVYKGLEAADKATKLAAIQKK